jgi:hypothetical protein
MSETTIAPHAEAFALQCIRTDHKRNRFIFYDAITFPGRERDGIGTAIRRLLGNVTATPNDATYAVLSIIDQNETEVQELYLTKRGFQYLQRTLKFRVIPEGEVNEHENATRSRSTET